MSRPRLLLTHLGLALSYLTLSALLHPRWWQGDSLGWDAARESWGDVLYGARGVVEVGLPLWSHLERGGYPFLADPQTALLYPPQWALYLGVWLFGGGVWVIFARSLMHMLIGAFGLRALTLRWGASPSVAWLMSVAWAFSGRLDKAKDSAGLWGMVWLPWAVWALDRLLERPTRRGVITLSLVMSAWWYAGYPPNLMRGALFVSLFALWRLPLRDWDALKPRLVALIGALLLTLGLCAPGLIATLDVLPETVRATLPMREVLMSRLRLIELFDVLWPKLSDPRGYSMLYAGLAPGLCALYALSSASLRSRRGRARWAWAGVGVLFALIATGQHSPVLPWLAQNVSLFRAMRVTEQSLYLSVFVWLTLAAQGAQSLLTRHQEADQQESPRSLKWLAVMCALPPLLLFERAPESAIATLITLTLLTLLWLTRARLTSALLLAGVSVITIGDLYAHHHKIYSFAQRAPTPRRDHELSALGLGERFVDQERWRWRAPARALKPELSGRYSTMVSARYVSYMKAAERHPQLLSLASVTLRGDRRRVQHIKPAPFASLYLQRCEHTLFTPLSSPKALSRALKSLAREPLCPLLEVDRPLARASEHKSLTPLTLTQHGWGEVVVMLSAEALAQALLSTSESLPTALIVVNEAWAAGWEARLERPSTGEVGRWRPTQRANVLFQGVSLSELLRALPSPNPSSLVNLSEPLTLRLRYHPRRLIYALYLALCALLVAVGVWWSERLKPEA